MRVEHLQKLHIGRDERHEIALVAALQLRGRQAPQGREHAVAHERQDAERQVVVAQLLAVAQRAAHDAANRQKHGRRARRNGLGQAGQAEQRVACEHGEEDGGGEAGRAQQHGQPHDGQQRAREPHEAQHDGEVGAAGSRRGLWERGGHSAGGSRGGCRAGGAFRMRR